MESSRSQELSFFPSISSNLVFSTRRTSPVRKVFTSSFSLLPLVSLEKQTLSPSKSLNLKYTGYRLLSFLSSSVFTLPKWERIITLAFLSIKYFIVFKLSIILVSSSIIPLVIGTFKSHLNITLLLSKLKSLNTFFILFTSYINKIAEAYFNFNKLYLFNKI